MLSFGPIHLSVTPLQANAVPLVEIAQQHTVGAFHALGSCLGLSSAQPVG